mmetsp:Transcript_7823/g.16798  ORF Transcript_7823/g.16798 Transcript_7823/m.16798 type:complete len:102 (+) Transcript_7823:66-371(+)
MIATPFGVRLQSFMDIFLQCAICFQSGRQLVDRGVADARTVKIEITLIICQRRNDSVLCLANYVMNCLSSEKIMKDSFEEIPEKIDDCTQHDSTLRRLEVV